MVEYIYQFDPGVTEVSAAGLFIFFFLATFVSEDGACVLAGTAAANGRIGFPAALAACFLGILVGDVLLFLTGRLAGTRVFENRLVRKFVSPHSVERASEWLENNAGSAVLLSRFVTGLRLPTYVAAGALRTDFVRFAFWFVVASVIWTPILVGSVAIAQTTIFSQNALLGIVFLLIGARFGLKFSSWKYRRHFVGKIKRMISWEFWPIQLFYLPVVVYVLLLALKHRSLTAFAAANPALPAGGFKGESKNDIYNALKRSGQVNENLLAYTLLRGEQSVRERLSAAWRFMDENRLTFPIVIKPDSGERGRGIRIVHSLDELTNAISSSEHDVILQEFAGGEEVSVFYYRRPHEPRGQIYSITEKRFPIVKGNGVSTIEELILGDPRAVALARKHVEHNKSRIDRIPAVDEVVRLIDIGTHSRGAIFLDGEWLKTPALESRIDQMCRSFKGFYFGRFDIRVPTLTDLQMGMNLKIVELNGVTSESTNIYDPQCSLVGAYTILFQQWRLAFEIGVANIELGAKRTPINELFRSVFEKPKGYTGTSIADTVTCA
jgi:membrane protein DedA with SNARE-associated domain